MKRIVKGAMLATAVITGAAHGANLENPLYIPAAGEVYGKVGAGLMYKEADDSLAMQAKKQAGQTEFPIYRGTFDLGYGITDRVAVRGQFGYTHDGDIDRKGMHVGRLGLNVRLFDGAATDGFVWDVYADAQLGGISPMEATLNASPNMMGGAYPLSFNYANYSNGRWGAWLGTQVGKTWGNFTGSAFVEVLRSIGNDNTEISVGQSAKGVVQLMAAGGVVDAFVAANCIGMEGAALEACTIATATSPVTLAQANAVANAFVAGVPKTFKVDTKSNWEYSAGLRSLYELGNDWSVGGSFVFKHRAANEVENVKLKVNVNAPLTETIAQELIAGVADQFIGSMKDGIDEYILSAMVARQMTENLQVSLYGEYTMDDAEQKSQNGTDVKAEVGVRLNARF